MSDMRRRGRRECKRLYSLEDFTPPLYGEVGRGYLLFKHNVLAHLILANLPFGHLIPLDSEAVGGFIQIDVEGAVVGSKRSSPHVVQPVADDGGIWLIRERIEGSAVMQLEAEMRDLITEQVIVLHWPPTTGGSVLRGRHPSPT